MPKFLVKYWRIAALIAVGTVLTAAPTMAGGVTVPIPEPTTLALVAGGAAAILILHRRRK